LRASQTAAFYVNSSSFIAGAMPDSERFRRSGACETSRAEDKVRNPALRRRELLYRIAFDKMAHKS